jgi:hypothetical protein
LPPLPPLELKKEPEPIIIDEKDISNFSNLIPNKPVKNHSSSYVFIPKVLNKNNNQVSNDCN